MRFNFCRLNYLLTVHFETFHLPQLFELLPPSDPEQKKFWKHETGSMFSLRKTPERCVWHMSELSLRNTLAFRSDYDCRTVFDSNFKQYLS